MVPRSTRAEEELKGFKLLVEEARSLPQGAQIADAGGNVTSLVLRDIKTNSDAGVSGDIFVMKYPEGTDVSDRRSEVAQ